MSEERQKARFSLWCNIYEWECKSGGNARAASHADKAVAAFDERFDTHPPDTSRSETASLPPGGTGGDGELPPFPPIGLMPDRRTCKRCNKRAKRLRDGECMACIEAAAREEARNLPSLEKATEPIPFSSRPTFTEKGGRNSRPLSPRPQVAVAPQVSRPSDRPKPIPLPCPIIGHEDGCNCSEPQPRMICERCNKKARLLRNGLCGTCTDACVDAGDLKALDGYHFANGTKRCPVDKHDKDCDCDGMGGDR